MSDPILIDQLATEVWNVYTSDPENAETGIEAFLKEKFSRLPDNDKLNILEKLLIEFEGVEEQKAVDMPLDDDLIAQISSLLLGQQVSRRDLSSEQLAKRLGDSLNTIFDTLNHLIGIINKTLWGKPDDDKTIRQVIGSQLSDAASSKSLETHLGQISKAFLIVQQSFQETARDQVAHMLNEIDPEGIIQESGRGFKFGPFRRADCYEIYKEKFERIKRWFDSGRFMEDFLREFEKKCQDIGEK